MGKRQRWKVTPSGDPGCQMVVSSTCSLNLDLAPKGEELTMETVMAVCSGGQENEKHIETQQCLHGERYGGPLGGETNLTTEQDNRACSQHLSSVQQEDLYMQPLRKSQKLNCRQPKLCPTKDAHSIYLHPYFLRSFRFC